MSLHRAYINCERCYEADNLHIFERKQGKYNARNEAMKSCYLVQKKIIDGLGK